MEHQYDQEFNNYLKIWEAMQLYIEATISLRNLEEAPFANFEEQRLENEKRDKIWEKCQNEFKRLVVGNAPFYQKIHYEKFVELDKLCVRLFDFYNGKIFNIEIEEGIAKKYIQDIEKLQNEILEQVRNYLQSIKVIEVRKPK